MFNAANAGAPCKYDEGAPLVQIINGIQTVVGIMSKNKGCALDSESVYTRVSVYYAWFLQIAGQQPPQSGNTVTVPTTTEGSTSTTDTTVDTTTQETTTTMTISEEPLPINRRVLIS